MWRWYGAEVASESEVQTGFCQLADNVKISEKGVVEVILQHPS